MNPLKFILFTAIFFSTIACVKPVFSQTLIKVVDQNGAPLPNAVIEFNDVKPHLKTKPDNTIYIMDQVNKAFVPDVLIVPENSLVSFPNSDDIRHHVYSFSPTKTFELKLYAGKPEKPILFEQSGVVVLGCNIHDSMVGYIYVASTENTYLSNKNGEVLLPKTLTLTTQLRVWHPNSQLGITKHMSFAIEPLTIKNNEITLVLAVNVPAARDTFEALATHEH